MNQTEWHKYPDHRPEPKEDYYVFTHSLEVLCYNGKDIYLGYLEVYDEEEDREPTWREAGRDGYSIENVTHWTYLPEPPQ
jgi:hypothetical protein